MKKFFRMTALAVLALVLFAGCKQDVGDEKGGFTDKTKPVEKVELSQNDPIHGTFSGNMGWVCFTKDISYDISANCSYFNKYCEEEDEEENGPLQHHGTYLEIKAFDWTNYDEDIYYFKKDATPTYVVYNTYSDGTGIDKHSGVVIFKSKFTPQYCSPTEGCYYGVKFQFLTEGNVIPEIRTPTTVYTNNLYIEGGYSPTNSAYYDNISDLDTAVEAFGFDNTAYFNTSSWNWSNSGASKQ